MIQGTMNQLATTIIQGSMAKSLKGMAKQSKPIQTSQQKPKMDESQVMAPSTSFQEQQNPWNLNMTVGTKSMATMAQAVYGRYDQEKKFKAHFDKSKKIRRAK